MVSQCCLDSGCCAYCQVILLPLVAPRHQSAAFVFTEFQGVGQTETGLGNNAMIFFVGMLMAQFA